MRFQGKIVSWKDDQGFGFVVQNGGGERAFVHIKSFPARSDRPEEGDLITYVQVADERNRFRAEQVRYVGQRVQPDREPGGMAMIVMVLFMGFIMAAAAMGHLPWLVPAVCLILSLVTFVVYAWDKSAAENQRWRTKESTLHLLALLGGWPGAALAQKMLRHKSKKTAFQAVFWLTVFLNMAALGGLLWGLAR